MRTLGRTDLPPEQQQALKKTIRWEWFTIGYTALTIALVALVLSGSQAMRTAWIEDMLSLIPQVSFLIALIVMRRRPNARHPYGLHRSMGIGHLVAGVALFGVGGVLAVESSVGLIAGDYPTIGTVQILGRTVWLGWLMMAVMAIIVIGPLFYGRAKAKLAKTLHNKVLFADAAMAKADWTTNAATIVGVAGIGLGIWWLDGAAALFISLGIVWDGIKNCKGAVLDLMDQRALTHDDAEPHPIRARIVRTLEEEPWVREAGARVRDMGQVFHVEAFVVPRRRHVSVDRIQAARLRLVALDWKVQDVVIVVVPELPDEARTL